MMMTGSENESSAVHIVSRAEWKAAEPRSRDPMPEPAQRVIIHHTALWRCHQPHECVAQLRHIQKMHMEERGFEDIGYNFLLGQDGTVYEGRGWCVVGAHAKNHNFNSIGIAFMGNFSDETPSSSALLAVRKLLQFGVSEQYLSTGFMLLAHRDVANTECPGEHLYSSLPKLRCQ